MHSNVALQFADNAKFQTHLLGVHLPLLQILRVFLILRYLA